MSEAIYLTQIRQLVELQKVDDEIFEVNQELANTPRKLEELANQFHAIEARRSHILEKIAHMNEQRKRLALEIDDDSAKIRKSKTKLMQVGNTREYQAVMREMDSMEKTNRTREEEKNTLMAELENQNSALENIDQEFERIKTELETRQASLDETMAEARQKLETMAHKRAGVGKDIPRPVFQRYEFIRKRLEHPVIVAVNGGICSGCHIAIPPQSFIELQTGQQILSCPNCQRLIYWGEHFESPENSTENYEKQARGSREARGDEEENNGAVKSEYEGETAPDAFIVNAPQLGGDAEKNGESAEKAE